MHGYTPDMGQGELLDLEVTDRCLAVPVVFIATIDASHAFGSSPFFVSFLLDSRLLDQRNQKNTQLSSPRNTVFPCVHIDNDGCYGRETGKCTVAPRSGKDRVC